MVLRANTWGWKATAARLLLAPLLAGGVAGAAHGQAPRTAPAPGLARPVNVAAAAPAKPAAPPIKPATKPRVTDPKELLRMGRDALRGGKFDEAQALARQADAANGAGRWGLFDDTPESLEGDIRSARARAGKAQSEQLTNQARELLTRSAGVPGDAQKLAMLDQAYNLADRAVTAAGPAGIWDDLFGGERPEKIRKEIEAARVPLRAKVSPAQMAKANAAPAKPTVTVAGTPAKPATGPIQLAGATAPAKPAVATASSAKGNPAGLPPLKPAAPAALTPTVATQAAPGKADAVRLVAEGRALVRSGQLAAARRKAQEAAQKRANFAPGEDNPDLLSRDALAEAKKQIDALTGEARRMTAAKQYANAQAALDSAHAVAAGMGFQTRPIEAQQSAVRAAMNNGVDPLAKPAVAVAKAPAEPAPAVVPVAATAPAIPALPALTPAKAPDAVAAAPMVAPSLPSLSPVPSLNAPPPSLPAVAQVEPIPAAPANGMVMPSLNAPPPSLPAVAQVEPIPAAPSLTPPPAPAVAVAPMPMPVPVPAIPAPAVAVAPMPVPASPAPAVVVAPVPIAPAIPAEKPGERMLADAGRELQRGDLELARKLATQAHAAGAKAEAQSLLREIDAAGFAKKQSEAVAAFRNAQDLAGARQYDQAMGVLKLIEADSLPHALRNRMPDLVANCAEGMAKVQAPAPALAQEADRPDVPPMTAPKPAGLSEQVKAMGDIEFQKLRAEGMDVETKARQAFDRGDTDLAITMLSDFTAKVKASGVSAGRQNLLLSSADRRLDTFRIMKRQTDFYTQEARDKKDAKNRIAGRSVAEQQQKEELAKKVREVTELSKQQRFKEAESLALQMHSLNPDDPTVSALYDMAKNRRRVDDAHKLRDSKEQFNLNAFNDAEKPGAYVDSANPLAVNVERSLKAMLRGDGSDLYSRSRTAKEREIEVKLDRPFTVEFQNKPLREAIDDLRKKAEINISTDDAALGDEQISLDSVTVTESLTDTSLKNVLTLLLDKARLKYVVENDVVRITTEKKAKGRLYTKVFSVMELVTAVPDFALADHQDFSKAISKATAPSMPWQNMGGGGGRGGLNGGELVSGGGVPGAFGPNGNAGILQNQNSTLGIQAGSGGAPTMSRAQTSQQLMKLITGMVRPYSWNDMGGAGKLDYYDIGGALVVNQTADVLREVQDLLDALRRLQDLSITVEVRVISLSESFFERVGVDFAVNVKTKGTSKFERQLTTSSFRPEPFINDINIQGQTVGWNPAQGGFTPDLDFPVRPSSFGYGVPPFGGYQGPNPNGGLNLGLAFLNDIQVFMFLEAAQGDRRVNIMQAPKITLFNGQSSTVSVNELAFFTLGLQVFNVGGQVIYLPQNTAVPIGASPDPITGQPGVSVTIQGIVSADRKYVRVQGTVALTALTSATVPLFPVTAFITPVFEGGSQGQPIPFTQFFQQPSFTSISVSTTVQVPDGGTVVLGGLKTLAEGRNEFGPPVLSNIPYINRLFRNQGIGRETKHVMLMVTPRIIINSEEEVNQTGQGGNLLPPPVGFPPQ